MEEEDEEHQGEEKRHSKKEQYKEQEAEDQGAKMVKLGGYTELMQNMIYLGSQEDEFYQENLASYVQLLQGHVEQKGEYTTLEETQGYSYTAGHIGLSSNYEHRDFEEDDQHSGRYDAEDENPWQTSLFDDLRLDEVIEEDSMTLHETTHTQNNEQRTECSKEYNGSARTEKAMEQENTEEQEHVSYITEEDIDNFLENERMAAEEGNNNNINSTIKPQIGMQFTSREEAQEFFNFYSNVVGFSMSVVASYRTISKKRNNEVTRVTMKCNRYGKTEEVEREQLVPQRQTTVIAKTDCKVEMVVNEKCGVWKITRLNLDHNHSLSPNSRFLRSHKYMSKEEKELIRTLKQTNTPTRNIVAILAYMRGGMAQLPYTKKDVSNYGTKINREMKNNDMMEVVNMFNRKQVENPGFYYSFELDSNNKVRSIFWTDARSRMDYELCGECISFDTTFLTNKYNLPFAPFVGVSTHGNTYLFACAFIVDETADTFKWVFRQFLTAMHGIPPISIITDQDKAMQNAIQDVFPNATHRRCLFHIKKKAEEKIGTCFQANQGLYEEFQDIIDNSLTEEEFEYLWKAMIEKYQVQHIKFFEEMWNSRKKFVPVYFKTKFFPFIQTTARSEGTNALFKKGVGAKFSVTSFLREYQRILDVIHDREDECEHNVKNKKVPENKFWSHYYIERQAHELYNTSIFKKFQKILQDTTRLQLREEDKEKVYLVFQAENYPIKEHRTRYFLVQVDLILEEFSCICCMFQKNGILCSHILKVMLHLNIQKIPEKYFIDRWRKKEKRMLKMKPLPVNADNSTLRFNVLTRRMVHMASNGSKNKRRYEYLLQEINRIEKEMEEMGNEEQENTQANSNSTRTVTNVQSATEAEDNSSAIELQDPDIGNTKGRPRMLTIREAIKKNRFYNCSHCDGNDHTYKNCPNKHIEYNLPKRKRARKSNPRNIGANGEKKNTGSKQCTNAEGRKEGGNKTKTKEAASANT